MASFPLSILLIPYGLFLLVFFAFSFVHMFHLGKFGASGFVSFVLAFVYFAGATIILYWSWVFLSQINWLEPIILKLPSFNALPGLE